MELNLETTRILSLVRQETGREIEMVALHVLLLTETQP